MSFYMGARGTAPPMRLRPVDGAARRGVRFHGVGVAPLCRSRKGDRDARAALPGGGV